MRIHGTADETTAMGVQDRSIFGAAFGKIHIAWNPAGTRLDVIDAAWLRHKRWPMYVVPLNLFFRRQRSFSHGSRLMPHSKTYSRGCPLLAILVLQTRKAFSQFKLAEVSRPVASSTDWLPGRVPINSYHRV